MEIVNFTEEYKSLTKILHDEHKLIRELHNAYTMITKLLIATMNLFKIASKMHIDVIATLYNYLASGSNTSFSDDIKTI